MKAEEIIGQIVTECPWVSREQILHRLEKEKSRTSGFISDETLLRVIAAEFGCVTMESEQPIPSLLLRDLIPGLNNVTIVGRVLAVFSPKEFSGIRKGKLASLLVADKNSVLRVVLWNDKTSLVETGAINMGQVVRFSHGYTRADLSGTVEFHVGEKGEVEIDPKDAKAKDYPGIGRFSTEIAELNRGQKSKRTSIIGVVKRIFPSTAFERKDGTQGRVMRFVLSDRTGEVPVVVWNEKAGELEKTLQVGDKLQVVNGRVKKALTEGREVHVDDATHVGPLTPFEEFLSIADLREAQEQINVEGEVATKPTVRDVRTAKGELLKVTSFELRDKTGRIWVSMWRTHADSAANLKIGDKIALRNGIVKRGFDAQLEISSRSTTSIDIIEP